MTRVIAIMNQKGGVGKTTTTINLGHALAIEGQMVTILDMDPQGQIATGVGLKNDNGLDRVLLDGAKIDDYIVSARDNLNILPAGVQLSDFEHVSTGGSTRGHKLRLAIEESSLKQCDYVLIDCPPSSGLLGINAMFSADELIVPVSGDYLSLQGLSRMMHILKRAESLAGREIKLWLVMTRMQMRRRLTQEVRSKVLKYFPGRVFTTVIRENVSLAESPSFGKTIFDYKVKSAGAEDYRSLANDILQGRTS
ncbi:ParA family protein [Pseudomonadota bacterium]|nr:ParA family protein [Pseudomonadota bacterium]